VICSGCANLHREISRNDSILIKTNPAGAIVFLNNNTAGVTPLTVELPRSTLSHSIKIIKEEYKTEEFVLSPQLQPINTGGKTVIINSTLFFAIVGLAQGAALGMPIQGFLGGSFLGLVVGKLQKQETVGTVYEYSPESVNINLTPLLEK
jgi:hypothetical protein